MRYWYFNEIAGQAGNDDRITLEEFNTIPNEIAGQAGNDDRTT